MLDTTSQDEFGIDADSSGGGNDWLRGKFDSKSDVVTDTNGGGRTYHDESKSDNHEDMTLESNGTSSFLFGLTKPTGGDASGSVDLTFNGGGTDKWHIKDKSEDKWQGRVALFDFRVATGCATAS